MGSQHTAEASRTLTEDLERQRLEHRAARMRLVIRELRLRADSHEDRHGAVPVPLRHAIAGFAIEMAKIERRLDETAGRAPAKPQRRAPAGGSGSTRVPWAGKWIDSCSSSHLTR